MRNEIPPLQHMMLTQRTRHFAGVYDFPAKLDQLVHSFRDRGSVRSNMAGYNVRREAQERVKRARRYQKVFDLTSLSGVHSEALIVIPNCG